MARLASETRSGETDHPRGHMVERIHRLHETDAERLAKLAKYAQQEDEPLRYRILGMIHDAKARQWVSDRREGIYVAFRGADEAHEFQELLETFVSAVERHSLRAVQGALEGLDAGATKRGA